MKDYSKMEGCEGLDSEMTELLEFQSDASEAISQDDEDELEELQNRCFTLLSGSYIHSIMSAMDHVVFVQIDIFAAGVFKRGALRKCLWSS